MAIATSEREKYLAGVPLFAGCTSTELQAVAGAAREVDLQPGEAVVDEGSQGVGFFMIVEGSARVEVHGKQINTLKSGDFFGEIALLDGGPRTASVVADTPLKVLGLTSWQFRPLLHKNPDLTLKILVQVCTRLRKLEAMIQ
jgi:CRP-like cAMP-binding protein